MFITVIYIGLLIAAGLIGFAVNIISQNEEVSKESKSPLSNHTSVVNNVKPSLLLTQTSPNASDNLIGQNDSSVPIQEAATNSPLNIVGLAVFAAALLIISFVHYFGRKKLKIYQCVNETYNYYSRLIHEFKNNNNLAIDVDDIEFFVSRLFYGDIERNMYREPITIFARKCSVVSDDVPVSKIVLVRETNGYLYSHWVVISKLGILILMKIKLGSKAVLYFKKSPQIQKFDSPFIYEEDIRTINEQYEIFDPLPVNSSEWKEPVRA